MICSEVVSDIIRCVKCARQHSDLGILSYFKIDLKICFLMT